MTLIRISPDGSETLHLYDDTVTELTSRISDMEITRATDVYYCNEDKGWKVKLLGDKPLVLPAMFKHRFEALKYEKEFLEEFLKENKKWDAAKRRNK